MKTIQTIRLKPNPTGKDRSRTGASESQLSGEWVDIKNVGTIAVDLVGVRLYHKAYKAGGGYEWDMVKELSGVLAPGEILRVYSGKGPYSVVKAEDKAGCQYYTFIGQSRYVWNNDFGDTAGLWEVATRTFIDQASYDPHPPEGVILQRSGDKLLAPAAVRSWR